MVPDSQFVVSRTALKDNSSFYQIDGRKVQFKEVAQLLRKHGIDLDHNRFLILQVGAANKRTYHITMIYNLFPTHIGIR